MAGMGFLPSSALVGAFLLEVGLEPAPGRLWTQVALLGGGGAGSALLCRARFRARCYGFSLWVDFLLLSLLECGVVIWLLWLAVRLFEHQPFPALILGILVFFLSVNTMAEVLHAGLQAEKGVRRRR